MKKCIVLVQGTSHPGYLDIDNAAINTWQRYHEDNIRVINYYGVLNRDGTIIERFATDIGQYETCESNDGKSIYYGGFDLVETPHYHGDGEYKYQGDPRPERFINTLEYCINNYEFDYIYRTGTTYYIDLIYLNELLKNVPDSTYCGSVFCDTIHKPGWFGNFVAGSNCLMSKDVAEVLVSGKENYLKYALNEPEDVATGRVIIGDYDYIDCKSQLDILEDVLRVPMDMVGFEIDKRHHNYKLYVLDLNLDAKRMYDLHELVVEHRRGYEKFKE